MVIYDTYAFLRAEGAGRTAYSHLAEALFFTACRFHEWAFLTKDRLVHDR